MTTYNAPNYWYYCYFTFTGAKEALGGDVARI